MNQTNGSAWCTNRPLRICPSTSSLVISIRWVKEERKMVMLGMLAFWPLLIIVNAMVTAAFVSRYCGSFNRIFFNWCWIILVIQIISSGIASFLPMDEKGIPFAFAIVAPVGIGTYVLSMGLNRIKKIDIKKIGFWASLGINGVAQLTSWLAAVWFLPRCH
jgi:hypothetical protein